MRKIIPALAIIAIISAYSCSKKKYLNDFTATDPAPSGVTLNASVASGHTYTLTLGNGGTANIVKQAAHFSVSQATSGDEGTMVYSYSPAKDYKGDDEVNIVYTSSASSSSGCSGSSESGSHTTTLTIKINVTE